MAKKVKPTLKVDKGEFLNFMFEDGVDDSHIKRVLKKKGNFALEDLVKICGYIPSDMIKNPEVVTKKFIVYGFCDSTFEVDPSDFTIQFV